jgi:hypothetical protein
MLHCKIILDKQNNLGHIVHRSNAVRRVACFLDVSSLNFGGAAKRRHFFVCCFSANQNDYAATQKFCLATPICHP